MTQTYHQHIFFFCIKVSVTFFSSHQLVQKVSQGYNQYHSSILYFKFIHPLLCSVLVSFLRYKILSWLHYFIGELDLRFWHIVNKISSEFCSFRCIIIKSYLLFFCILLHIGHQIPHDKKSCFLSSASLQVTTLGHKSLALIEMTKTGIETRSQFPHLIRQ